MRRALARAAPSAPDAPFVARPARLDALPQPRFLLRQLLVEPFELARLGLERGRLLLEVGGVAARPRREAAAIELDDPRGERRQEGAIVRDEEERAWITAQVFLEPADRVDVEMVGRLVEQQQVAARTTSARPSSARRRQPPDSSSIGRSAGSDSRETICSTFCSSRQPSRSSSRCCSPPSRSSAAASMRLRHATAAW